ncbi:MAG: cytidine deaminase [Candidatus Bipolaricaulota bacterium]
MDERGLVRHAVEAQERAYCPYSGFAVGAALLSKGGKVFTGCNVENVSSGLTVCAERSAVFKAISEGEREFQTLAVACGRGACTPCGACRQVLLEFSPELQVVMADAQGTVHLRRSLGELLPDAFRPGQISEANSDQSRS